MFYPTSSISMLMPKPSDITPASLTSTQYLGAMMFAVYVSGVLASKNIEFSKECLVSSAKQIRFRVSLASIGLICQTRMAWKIRSVTKKLKSQVKYRDDPATHPYIISRAVLFSIKWSESDTVGMIRLLRDGPSPLV